LKVEFDKYQNAFSSAYFMFLGANRCFGFWLDMHCVIFIALVTMSFLFFETGKILVHLMKMFNIIFELPQSATFSTLIPGPDNNLLAARS